MGFTQRGARSEHYKSLQETLAAKSPPPWLVVEGGAMTARVAGPPEVAQGETHRFNENVVIEYYSR